MSCSTRYSFLNPIALPSWMFDNVCVRSVCRGQWMNTNANGSGGDCGCGATMDLKPRWKKRRKEALEEVLWSGKEELWMYIPTYSTHTRVCRSIHMTRRYRPCVWTYILPSCSRRSDRFSSLSFCGHLCPFFHFLVGCTRMYSSYVQWLRCPKWKRERNVLIHKWRSLRAGSAFIPPTLQHEEAFTRSVERTASILYVYVCLPVCRYLLCFAVQEGYKKLVFRKSIATWARVQRPNRVCTLAIIEHFIVLFNNHQSSIIQKPMHVRLAA